MATCSDDNTVKIWNISNPSNWSLIRTYTNHTQAVFGLEWINENTFASGSNDFTIKIWLISTGETLRTINTTTSVRSLNLLTNGFYMACGLLNGNISIYNLNNGSLISALQGHISQVNDLIQNANDLLVSSSNDKNIRVWNLTTNSRKNPFKGHTSQVYGLNLISSDIVASGSSDDSIRLWNITNGQLIRNLTGHTSTIFLSIGFLSNSHLIVSGSLDQTIKLWTITTGECLRTFNTSLQIRSLAILNSSFETTSKNCLTVIF